MADRVLLLVDDEENILRSLRRLLRRDGYTILTANSGTAGLEILQEKSVGVIISDQRMPEMSGVEFLSEVKQRHPETVRLVLSGYTDLKSVTDAINQGAIYKFLTKPWDDALLRENIQAAFELFELSAENERLTQALQEACHQLSQANAELAQNVRRKSRMADLNLRSLRIAQEVLETLPMGILGLSNDGFVVLANSAAHDLLNPESGLVGMSTPSVLPDALLALLEKNTHTDHHQWHPVALSSQQTVNAMTCPFDETSPAQGMVMVLMPRNTIAQSKAVHLDKKR